MTTIEIAQKLINCVVVVEQGESIVDITEANRRASVVAKYPFSSKWDRKILAKTGPKGEPIATPSIWS